MTVRIEVSEEIERPASVVFKFYAEDHVLNHPRWDPSIELWLDSEAPIGAGTVIRRRNSRSGTPVEGTMEVVEWEPNRSMGVVTRDGPLEIHGRATVEEMGENRTRLTIDAEMPIDESMKDQIEASIQRSAARIKELIEAEK
jgi:hypothetical protein